MSFEMSLWIIGKKGGQFFSSIHTPAAKTKARTHVNKIGNAQNHQAI